MKVFSFKNFHFLHLFVPLEYRIILMVFARHEQLFLREPRFAQPSPEGHPAHFPPRNCRTMLRMTMTNARIIRSTQTAIMTLSI